VPDGAEVPEIAVALAVAAGASVGARRGAQGRAAQVVVAALALVLLVARAALGLPALVALDELGEVVRLLREADELVLEELARGRPLRGTSAPRRCCAGQRALTSFGARWRHSATNSLKLRENGPSSSGGGFFGIRKSTFIGCSSA
jgi:hypothetical protein